MNFHSRNPFLWIAGLFAVLGVACVFSTSSEAPIVSLDNAMIPIKSAEKSVVLGSTDPYAKKDEEVPPMVVLFDYNFSIDTTEVTQGQYEKLMGYSPITSDKFGRGAQNPIYNVTFFDAVLYCNARSKAAGLDTVYSYTEVSQDGHRTYALPGLAIHYERMGYRLPTEAEWEFAARGGVATPFPWGSDLDSAAAIQAAWFSGNAENRSHEVARLPPNDLGLYDMLGNVMEWTNDWKGPFAQTKVNDFLGAREPGTVPERVVKGGAFSYDMRYLRYSGRSANYPTLGSAAAEYVGFRCVIGVIPDGHFLEDGSTHAATPPISLALSEMSKFFGHSRGKLVFVNTAPKSRTLCFVDYAEQPPVVHEFLDDTAVFKPVISPDGHWVAYGNGDEGDARDGEVWVRRLQVGSTKRKLPVATACIPRWWTDSEASAAYLVYPSHCGDNLEPSWRSEKTYRIRMSEGVAIGEPEILTQGGYHDGLYDDGHYLVSGYRRLRTKNLMTGEERILFTGPGNGKPIGDTSQACNVSLSPPGLRNSPEMLVVDFGDPTNENETGSPYGLHEILFRIDTSGTIKQWYYPPKGYVAWQDVEWSNQRGYAVAVGQDAGDNYPAVVAVNLLSEATTVLATGTQLREPGLWLDPSGDLPQSLDSGEADSLGNYNAPPQGYPQIEYADKMRIFWLNRDKADVVCIGSSRTKSDISPEAFSHFTALNLGYSLGGLKGSREMLRHYVLPHCPRLRAVVFEVLPGWLYVPGGDLTWDFQMGLTKGFQFDSSHDFWSSGVLPVMDTVMRARTVWNSESYDSLGGGFYPAIGWGSNPPVTFPQGSGEYPDAVVSANLEQLRTLATEADRKGILFLMTLYPESPKYRDTPYYGKYGPKWDQGRMLVSQLRDLCLAIPHCRFYDANQEGRHDYDSSMAIDIDHLSTKGANILSQRLDSLITQELNTP